jgi:hypothetical protein
VSPPKNDVDERKGNNNKNSFHVFFYSHKPFHHQKEAYLGCKKRELNFYILLVIFSIVGGVVAVLENPISS